MNIIQLAGVLKRQIGRPFIVCDNQLHIDFSNKQAFVDIFRLWLFMDSRLVRIFCANSPSQQARGASYNLLYVVEKRLPVLSSVRVLRTAVPFDQSGIHKEPSLFTLLEISIPSKGIGTVRRYQHCWPRVSLFGIPHTT